MGSTPSIAYPAGISLALASDLSSAADGADTFGTQASNGVGTLTNATSEVSAVLADISSHSQGLSITAMRSLWDGAGAIGSGGLGTGGVISDASKAINVLSDLSGSMPGVSGGINEQLPAIKSGLAAISSVQANPNKKWTEAEATSLQSQITSMVSALEEVNSALLNTASAIENLAVSVKLGAGTVCASGVTPGANSAKVNTPSRVFVVSSNGTVTPTGGGGSNTPPGGGPPAIGGSGNPAGGDDGWFLKFIKGIPKFLKTNTKVAVGVGTFNTSIYATKDLLQGKNPLADNGFWQIYAANLAQGYVAGPVLTGAKSLLGVLGVAQTDGNIAIAQSILGSGMIGNSIVATPWLIKQLKEIWRDVS